MQDALDADPSDPNGLDGYDDGPGVPSPRTKPRSTRLEGYFNGSWPQFMKK